MIDMIIVDNLIYMFHNTHKVALGRQIIFLRRQFNLIYIIFYNMFRFISFFKVIKNTPMVSDGHIDISIS